MATTTYRDIDNNSVQLRVATHGDTNNVVNLLDRKSVV